MEEVERDFVPGRVQLLASPVDPLLARDHYSLADATGAAAVIEFTGPDTWEVGREEAQSGGRTLLPATPCHSICAKSRVLCIIHPAA